MSLMPSLCAALERAGGQRLVMRAGERPHVLAGERRHDVATAILSINAVEALVDQILTSESRRTLSEKGSVEETLHTPSFPHPLTARAERIGDDFCVELIVQLPKPEPVPLPEPELVTIAAADPEPVAIADPEPEPEPFVIAAPNLEPEPEPEPIVTHAEVQIPESVEVSNVVVAPRALSSEPTGATHPEPVHHIIEPSAPAPPPVVTHIEPRSSVRVIARVEEHRASPRTSPAARADLHGLIAYAFERGATTLFLRAGAPPAARINERIVALGDAIVAASVFEEIAAFTNRGGDGLWRSISEGEWARDHEDFGHVTSRVFSDDQGHGLVVQLRPRTSPRLLHKYIPRPVRTACETDGLIVVSAQNEPDAESLAAAIADYAGRARGGYLISLHRRSGRADLTGAFVSQRTVSGNDAEFASAVRRASHEGPDILLVAGPQSEIVLHEGILAAAAGRLVIMAVVAPSAVHALRTTLGQGGLDRDAHVRRALAASFRVAVGYRSLRRLGGGRMLVQDMVSTSHDVRALLEAGDFDGLTRLLRQGAVGVRSVDEALARATRRGHVSLREAAAHADDRHRLVSLVRQRSDVSASRRLAS